MTLVTDIRQVAYFNGEFLSRQDYREEQSFQLARRSDLARGLNGSGILSGLDVKLLGGGGETQVKPGVALDRQGRLIRLTDNVTVPPPAPVQDDAVLMISYGLVRTPPAHHGAPAYQTEAPLVAWYTLPPGEDEKRRDMPDGVILATRPKPGEPLDFGRRIYAPAIVGSISLLAKAAGTPITLSVTGTGCDFGLEVHAAETNLNPLPNSGKAVSQLGVGTALGIGTMTPKASIDVNVPFEKVRGPGRLTSHGTAIQIVPAEAAQALAPDYTLSVEVPGGEMRSAKILAPLGPGGWKVSCNLDARDQVYWYQRPLAMRIAKTGEDTAFCVDRAGNVGVGTSSPAARLDVDKTLKITGESQCLSFAGSGKLKVGAELATSDAGGVQIALGSDKQGVTLVASEGIAWRPGTSLSVSQDWTVDLDDRGNMGIGIPHPAVKLDVKGFIEAEEIGFVFPDGTIQHTAAISAPIGTVIDWYRPDAKTPVPENYEICDGRVIDNPGSELHDLKTPDLAECFICGASPDEPAGEPIDIQPHTHHFATPSHIHEILHNHPLDLESDTTWSLPRLDFPLVKGAVSKHHHDHPLDANTTGQSETMTGRNEVKTMTETTDPADLLPPYVGLLKLVRVS